MTMSAIPLSRSIRMGMKLAATRPRPKPMNDIRAVMAPKTTAENTGEKPSNPRLVPVTRLSTLRESGIPKSAQRSSTSSGASVRSPRAMRYRPYAASTPGPR
jgi:hypothetical protein